MQITALLKSGLPIATVSQMARVTRERVRQVAKRMIERGEIDLPDDYRPRSLALDKVMILDTKEAALAEASYVILDRALRQIRLMGGYATVRMSDFLCGNPLSIDNVMVRFIGLTDPQSLVIRRQVKESNRGKRKRSNRRSRTGKRSSADQRGPRVTRRNNRSA